MEKEKKGRAIALLPIGVFLIIFLGAGIVFQDFSLLKDRNVYENVAFAQRIVQTPGKEIKRNVPSILATVGLAGKYKAKPRQLSGGEQQRVAIARALVIRRCFWQMSRQVIWIRRIHGKL